MKPRTKKESRDSRRIQRAAVSLAAAPKSFDLGAMPGILPFQREWLAKAFARGPERRTAGIDLAALSAARGCGKSTLAGWIAACAVAPQGALYEPGGAVLVVAPTTSQGREVLLGHVPTGSECRILAASSKSLLGYGANSAVIVFDEVGGSGREGPGGL